MSLARRPWLGAALGVPLLLRAQAPLRLANAPYPPFVMPEGDALGDGMDIEIAREAVRRTLRREVQLVRMPWKRVLAELEQGEADFTTTISLSGDRRRFLLFTQGYRTEVRYHVYTRADSNLQLNGLADLAPLRLVGSAGFFYPPALRSATRSPWVEAKDIEMAVRMLYAQRVDGVVLNHLAGAWQVRQLGLQKDLQLQPFTYRSGSPTYMAVARARPEAAALVAALDRGLRSLRADGGLGAIERRYLG